MVEKRTHDITSWLNRLLCLLFYLRTTLLCQKLFDLRRILDQNIFWTCRACIAESLSLLECFKVDWCSCRCCTTHQRLKAICECVLLLLHLSLLRYNLLLIKVEILLILSVLLWIQRDLLVFRSFVSFLWLWFYFFSLFDGWAHYHIWIKDSVFFSFQLLLFLNNWLCFSLLLLLLLLNLFL